MGCRRVHTWGLKAAMAIALATVVSAQSAEGPRLLEALRRNDTATLRSALDAGEDAARADDSGATPLMYAALYAGPEALQALADKGAAVNVANKYGATPLMWAATASAANVAWLIAHGANVNAVASDGVTALVAAARMNDGEAMRLLLAAGADTKTPQTRTLLLTAAYFAPTSTARDLLAGAGVVLASAGDVKGPVLNRNRADLPTLSALLKAGVSRDELVTLNTVTLPSYMMAAREGQLDALKLFVAAGVDLNAAASHGWTSLMFAASSDSPSLPVLDYLIAAGVNLEAKDAEGRTALDWALTRGTTVLSERLVNAGAHRGTAAADMAATPTAVVAQASHPRTAHAAVEQAVARLQPAGPAFSNRSRCNSCHNQNLPGIAITMARSHGIRIDESLAGHSMKATDLQWNTRREAMRLGDTNNGGFLSNAGYTLLEMAEADMAPSLNSDTLALHLASKQNADGSWSLGNEIRPPLNGSAVSGAALAIRGLRAYTPAAHKAGADAHIARASAFLASATPRDTQEQVFKMLGLFWANAEGATVARERAAVLALQRADGGWGQLTTLGSDAYATGQALWALHVVGVPVGDAAYRKGVDYLLRTQREDGTWFVQTRAFGFQTYFETGFPHGRSQFISTTATAFAVMALVPTLEARESNQQ